MSSALEMATTPSTAEYIAAPVSHWLFGVPICAETMSDALRRVHDAVSNRRPLHIGVVNAAKIVNMRRDPVLRSAVTASHVVYADGMSVVWASRFLGKSLPERVAGIDLMSAILERGNNHGYRVYCLGATEAVLDKVCATFRRQYPGVTIAGRHHGYFDACGEEAVAKKIKAARADVLFVAITSPKKEHFMARWAEVIDVPVVHGVGGSFDVIAGIVERAPERWQRLGLEWLYRVKQEPGRLWKRYLVTNTVFLCLMISEKLKSLLKPH
jgi:N-acetylglucosaminyldiphosphoundecaprenol N-acetyl-beta-D-mannosaminyltransferase